MYSHGKLVDTSDINIVYTGTRQFRAHMKLLTDAGGVVMVGDRSNPRIIVLPVPSLIKDRPQTIRDARAALRRHFAAALAAALPDEGS